MIDKINSYLEQKIQEGLFPSAVWVIGDSSRIRYSGALGHSVKDPVKIPASEKTIYDLASLTKPLVTATLTLLMLQKGLIKLENKVKDFLDTKGNKDKDNITIKDLLCHNSGLPAWQPLYLWAWKLNLALEEAIFFIPIQEKPAKVVNYSCLGYILLGLIIEKIMRKTLAQLAKELIFDLLGMNYSFFNPPTNLKQRIAATEHGNVYERQLCKAKDMLTHLAIENEDSLSAYDGFRKELIWGKVHDHNCFCLRGVSGNSGLFSTVEDLALFARMCLGNGKLGEIQLLKKDIFHWMIQNQTAPLNEDRSLSWQLNCRYLSCVGNALSTAAYGHNGFTGTSLWIDPEPGYFYILLTNRIHPICYDVDIAPIRKEFCILASKIRKENL